MILDQCLLALRFDLRNLLANLDLMWGAMYTKLCGGLLILVQVCSALQLPYVMVKSVFFEFIKSCKCLVSKEQNLYSSIIFLQVISSRCVNKT